MPFSKTPSVSTYETKRVQFLGSPQERSSSSSKDQRFVNYLAEVVDPMTKRMALRTRPGVTQTMSVPTSGSATGFYVWNYPYDGTHIATTFTFALNTNYFYINGVLKTQANFVGGNAGTCGFAEHVDSVGNRTLVMVSNIGRITIWDYGSANGTYDPVTIPDAGSGTSFSWSTYIHGSTAVTKNKTCVPTVANGYYYIATTAGTTGTVEPTWPTTINATVTDGSVVWTCKGWNGLPYKTGIISLVPTPIVLDSYVFITLKDDIDIWNSNVDDPYSWVSGNYISAELYADPICCLSKNNNYLYAIGNNSVEIFYDAANPTGTPLARYEAGVKQFGTPSSSWRAVVQTDKEIILPAGGGAGGFSVWTIDGFKEKDIGTPAVRFWLNSVSCANLIAFVVNCSGQKLYILNGTNRTWVYSFETEMWFEWESPGSVKFNFDYGMDSGLGYPLVWNAVSGYYGKLTMETGTSEAASALTCTIITEKKDFDTINRKFGHRFSLIGDNIFAGNPAFQISWSDDDYNTWSTPRSLTMTQVQPYINQLGSFRRRAFKIQNTTVDAIRLEGFEIDINKGQA